MNLLQVMCVCAASAIGGFAVRASAEALYYRQDNDAAIAGFLAAFMFFIVGAGIIAVFDRVK